MTKSQDMSEAEAFEGFEAPQAQGLYDPAHERDACGVGFIADLKGRKSHQIVSDALKILANLEHRGAVGADPLAGDGAGMLIQIPHDFLKDECRKLGFTLPPPGRYAVGHIFMPRDERLRAHCERVWTRIVKEEGLELLGWRSVPVPSHLVTAAAVGAALPLVPSQAQWVNAGRVPVVMDTAKARRELRWRPQHDTREVLRLMVAAVCEAGLV